MLSLIYLIIGFIVSLVAMRELKFNFDLLIFIALWPIILLASIQDSYDEYKKNKK